MLRNIIVCRHAEATFSSPSQGDFGRPLTAKGQVQARLAGQWLKVQGLQIDAFVSSPAARAKETAFGLAAGLGWDENQITFIQEMYNAPVAELIKIIAALDGSVRGIVLVGHNPAISALSSQLCGNDKLLLDPANIVAISIQLESWTEVILGEGICSAHFRPVEE